MKIVIWSFWQELQFTAGYLGSFLFRSLLHWIAPACEGQHITRRAVPAQTHGALKAQFCSLGLIVWERGLALVRVFLKQILVGQKGWLTCLLTCRTQS